MEPITSGVPRDLTAEEHASLDDVFSYHAPSPAQVDAYAVLRAAGRDFAAVLMRLVPACADRTVALRCVREAVMNANAAIALEGRGLR